MGEYLSEDSTTLYSKRMKQTLRRKKLRSLFALLVVTLFAVLPILSVSSCQSVVEPITTSLRLTFDYKGGSLLKDSLYQVYPNPYARGEDSVIFITFSKADSGATTVLIQNPIGQAVATYTDSAVAPGLYSTHWNPIAADGQALNPGLYYVTLRTGNYINSRLISILTND